MFQYALATCIDFTPWTGIERDYIKVYPINGCFSLIGYAQQGGQILSIDKGCERTTTMSTVIILFFSYFFSSSSRIYARTWDKPRAGPEYDAVNFWVTTLSSRFGLESKYYERERS
jgi:hypothetical protein